MGEVINLRQARKEKIRAEKARKAKENRVTHGRSKSVKVKDESEVTRTSHDLDSKKLD